MQSLDKYTACALLVFLSLRNVSCILRTKTFSVIFGIEFGHFVSFKTYVLKNFYCIFVCSSISIGFGIVVSMIKIYVNSCDIVEKKNMYREGVEVENLSSNNIRLWLLAC